MLVQRILELIRNLREERKLIACDVSLCDFIFSRFSKKALGESLDKEDIHFLLDCYKNRWEAIIDTENDYTLNPSRINQLWIDFARELESSANRNYLKILIPTLINEKDINDFSPLTETVNLYNFYLGYGGNTLYRKLSFCQHLERWQFALSTYRHITERTLSVVSVEELTRLKLCKHTSKKVTINDESFENFWDLMRKKVFVHLADRGHIPLGLLPHLLELVERYYLLKSSGVDFVLFKAELKNFFRRLHGYEVSDVNALYGATVEYKDAEQYLLDVFIDLQTANNFSEIELSIETLGKWLFHFDSTLKASSKELGVVYSGSLQCDKRIALSCGNQSHALENCCSLLVSLLTTKFRFYTSLTHQSASFWDKSNAIPPELGPIFDILLPLIATNKQEAIAAAYDEIIKDIITPAVNDKSWFTRVIRTESTRKWLESAQKSQLNEMGGCWYPPELLFSALIQFNTNNHGLKTRIHHFLDDLIHTYAQDQNDIMKQIRVNVLFSEFLKGVNEHHRINLLRLIKLCDPRTAKSKFLHNCTLYINDRLSQLSQIPSETRSIHFFPQIYKLDTAKLFSLPEEMKDMSLMIAEYKTQLLALKLEPKISDKISSYLIKIGQPILTVEQKEMVRSGGQLLDYMGQYT